MYPNGTALPARDVKETSKDRLNRYWLDFCRYMGQAEREHWTGELTLRVNLKEGSANGRQLAFSENVR
jgi:hypothetical protein